MNLCTSRIPWEAGGLSNDEIGRLFGISYSALSHALRGLKTKMREDQQLTLKFNQLYSRFKFCALFRLLMQ